MLYTVAAKSWAPGHPLMPLSARSELYRWRSDVESFDDDRPKLAVAVRYDVARGVVVPEGAVARSLVGPWTAPAVVDGRGVVTVLAPIPGELVRRIGPAEVRAHPRVAWPLARPHVVSQLTTLFRPAGSFRGSLAGHRATLTTRAVRLLRQRRRQHGNTAHGKAARRQGGSVGHPSHLRYLVRLTKYFLADWGSP